MGGISSMPDWNTLLNKPSVVNSFNGSTGAVTGVSSFNGSTGAVTGVGSFNGSTGAVTGVASVNGNTGAVTAAQVIAANASAAAGDVGSSAFLYYNGATTFGTTRAGSSLLPIGSIDSVGSTGSPTVGSGWAIAKGTALAGTWRCMGNTTPANADSFGNAITTNATLWLRIA